MELLGVFPGKREKIAHVSHDWLLVRVGREGGGIELFEEPSDGLTIST